MRSRTDRRSTDQILRTPDCDRPIDLTINPLPDRLKKLSDRLTDPYPIEQQLRSSIFATYPGRAPAKTTIQDAIQAAVAWAEHTTHASWVLEEAEKLHMLWRYVWRCWSRSRHGGKMSELKALLTTAADAGEIALSAEGAIVASDSMEVVAPLRRLVAHEDLDLVMC